MHSTKDRRERALYMLLTGQKHTVIAATLQISTRTIRRWASQPEFAEALECEREAALEMVKAQARNRLKEQLQSLDSNALQNVASSTAKADKSGQNRPNADTNGQRTAQNVAFSNVEPDRSGQKRPTLATPPRRPPSPTLQNVAFSREAGAAPPIPSRADQLAKVERFDRLANQYEREGHPAEEVKHMRLQAAEMRRFINEAMDCLETAPPELVREVAEELGVLRH